MICSLFPELRSNGTETRTKSHYAVTGLAQTSPQKNEHNRKSLYADTTKLSPQSEEDNSSPVKKRSYSNVIDELHFKLNGNAFEDFNTAIENESTYNNQSIRSFGSSKTDESSVIMDPALEFLQDEPLYQFYDAAVLDVSTNRFLFW